MSRGRRAFPLAGLQAAAGTGLALEVAKALLGDEAARDVVVRGRVVRRDDLLLTANVDQDAFGRPSDYAHRMTEGDIRHEVAEMMRERAPEWAEWVGRLLAHDYDDIPTGLLSPLTALAERCMREVRSTIPKAPGKRTQTAKMPVRKEGPCSGVVVRTRSGGLYDERGIAISEEQAAWLLEVD